MENNEDLGEELSKLVERRNAMFEMVMGGMIKMSQYLAFEKQVSMAISEKEKEYWDKHKLDFLKMETKEIKINVPDGYEIDKENSTFECIKFKPVAKGWRDNEDRIVKGFYVGSDSLVHKTEVFGQGWYLFATEKQAKSALAMAQISQIMANDERFGGVVTDEEFENESIWIYSINRNKNVIQMYQGVRGIDHFLSFHTPSQRDLFIKENEDLVKDYLMID